MKKHFTLFLVLLLGGTLAAQAQTSEVTTKTKGKGTMVQQTGMPQNAMKDGVMMHGGKIMVVTAGQAAIISEQQTLSNGMVVMQNGTVRKTDGSTIQLKDGDHLNMDGALISHQKMPDDGMEHKSISHNEMGKTKVKGEVPGKPGKRSKSKLKAGDEKMKYKDGRGETKQKYDE